MQLLVADSFLVRSGEDRAEVRGLPLHLARFRSSALEAAAELTCAHQFPDELDAFLAEAPTQIAAAGAGFPRLELTHDEATSAFTLALRPRPAPPLTTSIELRSVPRPAHLGHPARKGPGIAAFAELRASLGAELLLLDDAGHALEGGTTSLLWWMHGNPHVARSVNRVPSVTERLLIDILSDSGFDVRPESAAPADLVSCEVWALNALHGVRQVTSIDGIRLVHAEDGRLNRWRDELERSWQPVG